MQIQRTNVTAMTETNIGSAIAREAVPTARTTPAAGTANHEDVTKQSVKKMGTYLEQFKDAKVEMEYDKEIDRVIVKYINQNADEVVSQIPSEKFVAFEKEFVKTIGLLFDLKL